MQFVKLTKGELVEILVKARAIGEAEREAATKGVTTVATKQAFMTEIQKRADELYPATLSRESRFTRCITQDAVGKILFKALQGSPLTNEREPAQERADAATARRMESGRQTAMRAALRPGDRLTAELVHETAEEEMDGLVRQHMREYATKTYAGAYSSVFADPSNRELAHRVKNEHLGRGLAVIHGNGAIS